MDKKILSLLNKHKDGLSPAKIQSELQVTRRGRTKLLEHLKKLEREGAVRRVKSRYLLPAGPVLVRGTFVTSRPGFGFVAPLGGGEDIFVPARHAEGVFQGDEVEVIVSEKGRFGKREGRISRILRRGRSTILGIYDERGGTPFLRAFESPSVAELPLRGRGPAPPGPGTIVEADRNTLKVVRIFGRPDDPGVDARVTIRRFGLPSVFSEAASAEAEGISAGLTSRDLDGRRDFSKWRTVTIDGEKAQDFDDAVSIEVLENGRWLLGVHIADVGHYVKPGTALDRDARERGTSVYFPGLTLPMLPEKLSNDLCSLRPRRTRLTVSALLEIDERGRVIRSEFTPSVIRTAERMTYASVQRIFDGDREETGRYPSLVGDFLWMRDAARALRRGRLAEGSLDFDLVEPELVYEGEKLREVAAAERTEAHRLIEEFMVAANVAVASRLEEMDVPSVYRIHPAPLAADLEKLREILRPFGHFLPEAKETRSKDLQALIERTAGRPEEKFVNVRILRAMRLAVYSEKNLGHYGLAKKTYTHFTSPIRRYPDLAVHRILKAFLGGEKTGPGGLEELALDASEKERNADAAEAALLEWRILRFLRDRLGDEFGGTVVDVAKAGLLVELDDYFVAGLLPFEALDGRFEPRSRPASRRTRKRKRFDLGDRVRVILVSCDPVWQRMSFMLAPDGAEASR
jgi:ribonuclease R